MARRVKKLLLLFWDRVAHLWGLWGGLSTLQSLFFIYVMLNNAWSLLCVGDGGDDNADNDDDDGSENEDDDEYEEKEEDSDEEKKQEEEKEEN